MSSLKLCYQGKFQARRQNRSPHLSSSGMLYQLFFLLPFVDSINGMLLIEFGYEGAFSVGEIYRALIIICALYKITERRLPKRSIVVFILIAALLVLPHLFDFFNTTFFSLVLKTVLPVLCIEAFLKDITEGRISYRNLAHLVDVWSLLFPMTILIPFSLGLGFQTYAGEGVGYRGYFYAANDLCFVLSILFFFSCGRIHKDTSIVCLLKAVLIGICILMLGMKSGYLLLIVSIVYWTWRSKVAPINLFYLFCLACVAVLLLSPFVSDIVASVVNRWMYFANTMDSFFTFLTSGRLERIPTVFNCLLSTEQGSSWLLFGVGLRYSNCLVPYGLVEMDPFDLFFQFGLLGSIFLIGYYLNFSRCGLGEKYKHCRFALWIALVFSMAVGHVLNSALSGMVLAVLCGLIWSGRVRNAEVISND